MTKQCMTKEEIEKRMEEAVGNLGMDPAGALLSFAASLQMHGVVIVSPVCPDCGALHDWRIMSNIGSMPGEDSSPEEAEALMEARRQALIGLLESRLLGLYEAAGVVMPKETRQ